MLFHTGVNGLINHVSTTSRIMFIKRYSSDCLGITVGEYPNTQQNNDCVLCKDRFGVGSNDLLFFFQQSFTQHALCCRARDLEF